MGETAELYERHGIDPRYDSTNGYGRGASYYGNGKYPPDWAARRDAVWERQRYWCGRCGRYKGDVGASEVHHVIHLADGGANHLDNLVGLCSDCHALMHPDVDELRGHHASAPLFPDEGADPRVSVVRRPVGNETLATDVSRLGEFGEPDRNEHAVTELTVPTSATLARDAADGLYDVLVDHGCVPRSRPHHRVRVVPRFTGVRGLCTSHVPTVRARNAATAAEREWRGGNDHCDVFVTPDASAATVRVVGGEGDRTDRRLRLNRDGDDGARKRLELPVSPPPLSLGTAPRYALDAARYFGARSLLWGILPALLLAWLAPALTPAGDSLVGLLAVALVVGLALRAPGMVRHATDSPDERVVDERAEGTP